jgi:DNA polymerase III subunit epsilon
MPRLITKSSFWLFVLLCLLFFSMVVGGLGVIIWDRLSAADQTSILRVIRQHVGELIGLGAIFIVGLAFIIDWVYRLYILPIDRLTEEVSVVFRVNPAQRIKLHGSKEAMRLVTTLNTVADYFEDMGRSVEDRIREAGTRAEAEKQLLAMVIAELPQGVLICNSQGQITLYNERAQQLLHGSERHGNGPGGPMTGGFVGLGRSVFGVLDKNIISHALGEITDKMRRGQPDLRSSLVATGRNERLMRIEIVPVLGGDRDFTGFILILTDISQQLAIERRVDTLFQTLMVKMRAAVASIRAAIEIIHGYPDLEPAKHSQMQSIIYNETLTASVAMDDAAADFNRQINANWPLARMRLSDLLEAVCRRAEEKLAVRPVFVPGESDYWVRVDSYSMSLALLFILDRLMHESAVGPLRLSPQRLENFLALDICWTGIPVRMETIRRWERQAIAIADDAISSTVKDVLDRHGTEIWAHTRNAGTGESYLRILLPAADPKTPVRIKRSTLLPVNRPVFFDFDIFSRLDHHPELDNRMLTELAYTVFDTETTGLDPRGGDEIISVGAVRIINGKMLEEECFEQLVNPHRLIPWSSVQIHGIQPKVLEGQPDITQVLPMFHKYAEGTILVGHNVAFDLRLLQQKETLTGIRFANPVLDTMLLSAIIQPAQHSHDLEAIAERLGIAIIGRHTALGDAMGAAEIFLKLIPLLAAMGIQTLKQAREASQKTYYARLKY